MFKCEIWNKTDDIKGTPASDYLGWNPSWESEDVIIVKYGEVVSEITSVNVIKYNNKMDVNLTSQQVCEEYARIKNGNMDNEINYAEKISILEAKNKKLEENQIVLTLGQKDIEYTLTMEGMM